MEPFPFESWEPSQWVAFAGLLTAGLAALALLILAVRSVRAWRTPTTYYARRPDPRPTLALAAERVRVSGTDVLGYRWSPIDFGYPDNGVIVVDPTDVAEHLAAGPGSLTDLAAITHGMLERIELVDDVVHRWFVEAFDRPAHVPGRDEARELDEGGALTRFRAGIESAMRTAHLWEIQGRGVAGHDSARMALDHWRAGTATGEWAIVPPVGGRLPAAALAY